MIKPMSLSLEERAVEIILDEAGLLHDMNKEHFRGKEDVVVLCCPDGRQYIRGVFNPFMDMYDGEHKLCLLPLTEYGGTIILDDDSPLVQHGHTTAIDLVAKIKYAVKMGYKAMCPINHFPCGIGREHKIHPVRIVDSLMHAKERIKKKEGVCNITIANFLQITDGERRRISRIPYNDYLLWRRHHNDAKVYDMIQNIIRRIDKHQLVNNELQNLPNVISSVI